MPGERTLRVRVAFMRRRLTVCFYRRLIRLLAAGVLTVAFVAVLAGQDATDLAAGYVGADRCALCHEDITADFQDNPHNLLETLRRGEWKGRGCEACHGAGAEHAETIEVDKIFSFPTSTARAINQSCLACHAKDETHRDRSFDSHTRSGLDCTSCHSVHRSRQKPLLASESNKLCSSCHVAERAAFNRPFRHRLHENGIGCVDCHNPHGGSSAATVRWFAANELVCLKCHADKRGPFPFEHAPVKLEPCTSCHEPHGSANPRMLVRHNSAQLCLECHAGSLSTLGGVPPAFHDLRSARFQNCTICHSKIHGSFISRDFLR